MPRVLLTTLALAMAACARTTRVAVQSVPPDLADASAPLIGCTPDEIRIEDLNRRPGDGAPTDWIATCDGKVFYCVTQGSATCTLVPEP
jgi:hypothetical protein